MARALSLDLRERVIAAIEAGRVVRTGGGTVRGRQGERDPLACKVSGRGRDRRQAVMGGDRHSHRIEAHAALILQAYEARPQIYLREVKDALEENGATASLSGLSRFFRRHGITRKKGISTPPSKAARM